MFNALDRKALGWALGPAVVSALLGGGLLSLTALVLPQLLALTLAAAGGLLLGGSVLMHEMTDARVLLEQGRCVQCRGAGRVADQHGFIRGCHPCDGSGRA